MTEAFASVRRAPGVDPRPVDALDAHVDEEEVEVAGQVVRLSGLASAIVRSVPPGRERTVEEITADVVAQFGEPDFPDSASELTHRHVHDLAAHGVLTLVGDDSSGPASEPPAGGTIALRSALRHVLAGEPGRWQPPPDLLPGSFIAAARQHHVDSFLASHQDRLDLSTQLGAVLRAAAAKRASAARALAQRLDEVLDVLDDAGVHCLTVKGLALARQAYGDFTVRGAGDLDLLVAPRDLETAHAALTGAGWTAAASFPAPGSSWAWRHFRATGHELSLDDGGTTIDLHWHLAPTWGIFPEFDALWSRHDTVRVGRRDVATLGRYDALAHSSGHAAKDHWRWLRSLVDVHTLAASADTWLEADRRLRPDQLTSLGLAVRLFGLPEGAPPVMQEAPDMVSEAVWSAVTATQTGTAATHVRPQTPGAGLLTSVRGTLRTEADPRETLRLVSRNVFPPWLTSKEPSPHAIVAVPRVLRRRVREVIGRLRGR